METNIAFTHHTYPAGGAERTTADIAAYLASKGHKIYLFVERLQRERLTESDKRNITFITVKFWGRGNRAASARFISEEINRLGIDVFTSPMAEYTDLGYIKRNASSKIIYSLHSLPLWDAVDYLGSRTHKALHSGSLGKMAEWFLMRYPHELLTGKRRRALVERYKKNYLDCDIYTVLCEQYKQQFIEILGPDIATPENNHIEVVPNFVPPHDYAATAEKKKQVLFIGRLSYGDKRIDRLLDIWALVHRDFPDWELLIVGDGEEKPHLECQSERLHLTGVRFCGYSPSPDEYYRSASIICLTSSYEGWPLVIAEGQQAGAVPIAFDVSAGVNELLSPSGVNGILVPPFDEKKYASELARLMGDEKLREDMRRNVVEKSREYSRESRLARWEELINRI